MISPVIPGYMCYPFFAQFFFWIDQKWNIAGRKRMSEKPRFISDLFITLPRNKNTDTNYLFLFNAGSNQLRSNEVIISVAWSG